MTFQEVTMESPIRRNSQQTPDSIVGNGVHPNRVENGLRNGILKNPPALPNVMTSPVIMNPHQRSNGLLLTEEEDTDYSSLSDLPKPPDGGWGWAVVFASFMIHVIADGITYTLGIYVGRWKEDLQEGSGSVSFIPSILVGITLGSGPIASMLVNRYGCRLVTIVGAICAAIGLTISAASKSLILLYLSIGVLTGIGFGLIYLPAIVCVSMYFEKKRAFATGIAVCGSGLGTFIMAPLTQHLIENFDWQISLVITGVIVLLNIFFGALFKPLPMTTAESCSTEETPNLPDIEENEVLNRTSKNHSFCSDQGLPPEIRINGEPLTTKPIAQQMGSFDGKYSQVARMALSHPALPIQPPLKDTESYGSHSRIYDNYGNLRPRSRHQSRRGSQVMLRKDILYSGSLYNIPEYKSNPRRYSRYHIKTMENVERSRLTSEATENDIVTDIEVSETPNEQKCCQCIPISEEASKGLHQMINVGLFRDPIFVMFVISNFFTSIGFNVPYVYTVDRARQELNIEEKSASYLLSVIGIANTLGRIFLGYVSDRKWINRLYLYNICLAICGISMALSNFSFCNDVNGVEPSLENLQTNFTSSNDQNLLENHHDNNNNNMIMDSSMTSCNYVSQAVYCAIFGITSGAYVGLTSVVLVDLLGLDNLTNAFGLLLLFQGIASVIGPPFIGWLYDVLGAYSYGFYFSGAMIFLSGVMLFALPKLQQKQAQQNKDIYEEEEESGFPEIVEEEGYDSDDHQMTMEAKPKK